MDDSSFSEYRERIGSTLTSRLNDAFSQGAISPDESPIVARFILDRIDKLNNHHELMQFLEELTQKWPLFGPILMSEHSAITEEKKDEVVNQAEQLIKENKIEEAIDAVEDANNKDSEGGTN